MENKGLDGLMMKFFPSAFKKGEWWLGWPWFIYRELWHAVGGALCGVLVWSVGLLSPWARVALAALFGALILAKETREAKHQPWYKTVADSLAWVVPFVMVIS